MLTIHKKIWVVSSIVGWSNLIFKNPYIYYISFWSFTMFRDYASITPFISQHDSLVNMLLYIAQRWDHCNSDSTNLQ